MKNLFENVTGGWTRDRELKLKKCMSDKSLPADAFEITECGDEKTGRRFGQATVRRGFACKLGGGGRNRRSRYAYQVWAVVRPEYR